MRFGKVWLQMNWIEVALLIFGVGAFAGSFLIRGKSADEEEEQHVDIELIRTIIEKEMGDAKERVAEVVDETLEYAVEKTERASERISNEKIMAISEYSETVLSDINKSHQEVMFLYDMLNDKHNNLKETVKHVDKTAREAEEAANAAAIALAAKAKEDAEAKEREKLEENAAKKEAATKGSFGQALQDKDAMEKEHARHQMARLILPMQQEMTMRRQADARSMDLSAFAVKPENKTESVDDNQASELRPLVVKSVEIVSSNTMDMPPVSENIGMNPAVLAGMNMPSAKADTKSSDTRQVEVYSFTKQAPRVERPVKKEAQAAAFENTMNMAKRQDVFQEQVPAEEVKENNNDRILSLHKQGVSNVDIAKELGLGVGEVKLVISLFKGAV